MIIGFIKAIIWEIKELPASFKRGWEHEMEYRERRDDNYYRDRGH